MDRWGHERIDYKSARDVVTEADHVSEALILDAIRARYPETRSWPRRLVSIGHRGEAPTSAWPGVDRRSA